MKRVMIVCLLGLIAVTLTLLAGGSGTAEGQDTNLSAELSKLKFEIYRNRCLIMNKPDMSAGQHGAQVGIHLEPLKKEVASAFGLGENQGGVITKIGIGGPAQHAGLAVGDVILKVNGKPLKFHISGGLLGGSSTPMNLTKPYLPGTRIVLKVMRKGEQIEKTVLLGCHSCGNHLNCPYRIGSLGD